MVDKILNVKAIIKILFSDGQTYELPLVNKNYMTEDLDTYGTSIKLNEQLYSTSNANIVGNICCNDLSIEAVSYDKLLVSSNTESPYFGLMNDTAMVDLSLQVEDEPDLLYMGRYFVSAWENGTTSSTANNVSISCVDLLSKIKNIPLDKLRLKNNISVVDYLKIAVDSLNSKVADNLKIKYRDDDLNIYKNSKYDWQMHFINIDRTDIESIFNNIAQNTVSYLWIDRDGYLKTDHLLDDKAKESVCTLSGSLNILEYGSQSGDVGKVSGIEVEYIDSVTYETKELFSTTDYQLVVGNNKINNIQLNSDKVFNIHMIRIECEEGQAFCKSFNIYKKNIDLVIESTNKTKASIQIWGTILNETKDTLTVYVDDNKKGDIVKIDNNILRKELINAYANGLVTVLKMKNNRIYTLGWINPRVKLGDLVYMLGSRLGVNDYYKVIGLELTLGTSYRCKASLIRTMEVDQSFLDLTYQLENALYDRLTGVDVDINDIVELTEAEAQFVEKELNTDLVAEFRNVLYGGDY